jgi:hypothetical protein
MAAIYLTRIAPRRNSRVFFLFRGEGQRCRPLQPAQTWLLLPPPLLLMLVLLMLLTMTAAASWTAFCLLMLREPPPAPPRQTDRAWTARQRRGR